MLKVQKVNDDSWLIISPSVKEGVIKINSSKVFYCTNLVNVYSCTIKDGGMGSAGLLKIELRTRFSLMQRKTQLSLYVRLFDAEYGKTYEESDKEFDCFYDILKFAYQNSDAGP